jgi:putative addiction module killer protein
MRGYPFWQTKRRRPEPCRVLVARHLEILATAKTWAKVFLRDVFMSGRGYRVYYTRTGLTVYVLLAGGIKASQAKDIAKAKKMARELKRAKQ